jgi:transcriptional regulator with XRE-family HTH domain
MRTQKELANILKVSPQHLNAVIKGRVRPSLKLALRLEQETGIPIEKLIPELKGAKSGSRNC